MNGLTRQELDLLIEALVEWESAKNPSHGLMAAILSGSAMPLLTNGCDDPDCESCVRLRAEFDKMASRKRDESKLASERSILLRAKLIGMRDSQAADKLFSESQGNG